MATTGVAPSHQGHPLPPVRAFSAARAMLRRGQNTGLVEPEAIASEWAIAYFLASKDEIFIEIQWQHGNIQAFWGCHSLN